MTATLIQQVEKHISLTIDEKEFFVSFFKQKTIRKRQYFLQEGEVALYTAFVVKGCLRSYLVDENDFEHILQFAIENWWIGDMASGVNKTPSRLNIDALENSEVLLLTREDQYTIFEQCPKFERYFRIITENALMAHQQRILENISLPAIERYKIFAERYPSFVERLPQTQIASYLGITPEFLSKIRHQMAYQKP